MPKRRPRKVVPKRDHWERLRKTLEKRTKGELIDALVECAKEDRKVLRQLDERFELESSAQELAALTRQAIADATDFDERDSNRNFSYDYAAYSAVRRHFSRLIGMGELRLAMQLSLELMGEGSCQVECSDEGLMTEDIEECLRVALKALKKSDLSPEEGVAWCKEMHQRDRVQFICERELQELQQHFQALRP